MQIPEDLRERTGFEVPPVHLLRVLVPRLQAGDQSPPAVGNPGEVQQRGGARAALTLALPARRGKPRTAARFALLQEAHRLFHAAVLRGGAQGQVAE